jgi:salicylate hydroxylase
VKPAGTRIAVIGAGIGGLTFAAALRAAGTRCDVFEQARELAEVGAGVQLAPNATRPLRCLGAGPALDRHAVRIEAMEHLGWAGDPIARTVFGAECERMFGVPYLAVHRAHLQRALLDVVDHTRLRLGRTVARLEPAGDGVRLTFDDDTTYDADLVVGADGIHSVVREVLVRDAPVFAGLGVFRGLVPVDDLPPAAREPSIRMWLGPGRHFVCYPVAAGRLLSFAAIAPLRDAPVESWSAPGDPADLVAAFDGWQGLISDVTRAARDVRRWALYDRPPLHTWSTDRVTLIGDAAHPMLPFLAQGANQAVEDAVELAAGLAGAPAAEIPAALAAYAAARVARTAAIQRASRGHAEYLHLPDGPRRRERDRVFAGTTDLRERVWLFDHRPGR